MNNGRREQGDATHELALVNLGKFHAAGICIREERELMSARTRAALPTAMPEGIQSFPARSSMTITDVFFLVSFLALIGFHMGRDEEPAQKVVEEKKEVSDKKKAELYAQIIAGCLNGQWIFIDDKPAAACRRIK